ncbi:MAG: hypothetical protein DSZ29_00720 [Aquificaceae bacterium]|nr:MAG: hypothetical protein DSZ29_00720 [Aquificaceae bacterium]
MKYFTKNSASYHYGWISSAFLLLFLLSFNFVSSGQGSIHIDLFKVQPVVTKVNTYKVQVNLSYQLSDYLSKSLLNGIILKSQLQFYYEQPNNWFWNKQKRLATLKFQLKYHALSRHYLLSRNDTNEHWNFGNISAALRKMGEIRNYELPPLPAKEEGNNRYISAVSQLEPSSLSLPLRLQSFLSDKYRLVSQEVRWPLP